MAKLSPVRQTYYYHESASRVFQALTDPKLLVKWFVDKAVVTPKRGGAYRLTWAGGYSMRGRIESIEAPNHLTVEWVDRMEGGREFETVAHFELKKRGRGTLLSVTHRGFKSGKKWVQLYGAVQSGWAYYLTNLRSVLEHQTDLRATADSLGG
jgi:uncharacterized protein YndB with AHSA1/START domain